MRFPSKFVGLLAVIAFAISPIVIAQQPAGGPKPVPVSPAEAQKLISSQPMRGGFGFRADGTVKVEFTVNTDGGVQDITSTPLGDADGNTQLTAKNIVSRWHYHPYLANGKPMPMRTSAKLEIHGPNGVLK